MRKKFQREKKERNLHPLKELQEETIQTILGILFFVAAVLLVLASLGKAGVVGASIFNSFTLLLGLGYYLLPLLFLVVGVSFFQKLKKHFVFSKIFGSLLFFLSGLGIIDLTTNHRAGLIGKLVASPLFKLFDLSASIFVLVAVILISFLIILDMPLNFGKIISIFRKKDDKDEKEKTFVPVQNVAITPSEESAKAAETSEKSKVRISVPEDSKARNGDDAFGLMPKTRISTAVFTPPPLALLEQDKGKPGVGDIKANANVIKRTLQNFGITVEMDEISIGPSVTRYSLKPAEGVKLSKIVALQNDLSLALAAHPLRIEAPIPGKSLVGIEIPNSVKTTVGLGTLIGAEEFQTSEKALLVALGKSVSGKSHFSNLAKMPHLLLAGATGSGKSVTIHSIITSLLYRGGPDSLKFIMIDPKRVELTLYNKIPHLLTPVITEPKKAILALKWAAKEMDRRYDILETESVRDIESYHKNILSPVIAKLREGKEKETAMPETMPYIVIVIDELADIMTMYPRELEAAIVRLAQMSRAVGIHLILSTQRPSVDVITGLIKANVPARIALQVSSQIDSRTILDTGGAEKLLGAGDLLYLSGEMSKPLRLQSPFISEVEVKNVVKFLVKQYESEAPSEINLTAPEVSNAIFSSSLEDDGAGEDEDPLYEEAREIIVTAGKASTSYLQRKLRIGYARAARLMDTMQERGVIAAGQGAKAREVLGESTSSASESPDDAPAESGVEEETEVE